MLEEDYDMAEGDIALQNLPLPKENGSATDQPDDHPSSPSRTDPGYAESFSSTDSSSQVFPMQNADEIESSFIGPAHEGTNSIAEASFNFINSIVGAGIIGMPYAMNEAGFGFGIILIIIMGCITDYSILLLLRAGLASKKYSYTDLAQHALGKTGSYMLAFGQFFFPFFGMVAYSIITGQTLPKVFDALLGESFLSDRQTVIGIMTIFVMIPLSINKNIESLSKWSFLAICGVIILIIIVCFEGSKIDDFDGRGNPFVFIKTRFVQAIGVMAFAYVCHHNTFLIYTSLRNRNLSRFGMTTHISVSTAALLSIILGVGGYTAFGDKTKDDILDNFDDDNTVVNVARLFFSIVVMLTYPIECFVAREVIHNLFLSHKSHLSEVEHYGISLVICAFVLAIALSTSSLGVVLELNGVINANLVAFILPGLCGAMLLPGEKWYKGQRLWPTILAAFGIALFLFGVVLIAIEQSS